MIVPLWPTQPWYSQLLHLIMDVPRTLPQQLTTLKNSAMVLTAVTPDRGCSKDTSTTDHAQNARERTRTTPANQEDGSDGMQIIRESAAAQGISQKARDIIVQPWRQGTQKQYSSYIKRWISFVIDNKLIVFPSLYPKR